MHINRILENNNGAFYLHRHEWEPILPYPDPVLPSDKVRVLPTLWEVGPLNNNFKGAGVLFVSFGCFGCGCLGS